MTRLGRRKGAAPGRGEIPSGPPAGYTPPAPNVPPLAAEELARLFHEAYERLAPSFDYSTRPESAVAWEDVPEANRNLMVATAADVLEALEGRGVLR